MSGDSINCRGKKKLVSSVGYKKKQLLGYFVYGSKSYNNVRSDLIKIEEILSEFQEHMVIKECGLRATASLSRPAHMLPFVTISTAKIKLCSSYHFITRFFWNNVPYWTLAVGLESVSFLKMGLLRSCWQKKKRKKICPAGPWSQTPSFISNPTNA
jgi:hypothetical protein